MVATRYALDEFIHDMTELVAVERDQARLFDRGSSYLERLLRNPEAIPEQYRRPAERARRPGGGSFLLHRGPNLIVTTVIWGPGQYVGPHDHCTWGMIGVLGNGIQETRYQRMDERERDGYARLVKDRTYYMRSGEVSLLVPEQDEIHALDNFSDRPTVEVHVYGRDLVGLERHAFDLETGAIKRLVTTGFDNC